MKNVYITNTKRVYNKLLKENFLPEKNCTISSLLQPKGRPRSRTSPSPVVSGQFGPVCFMTQSISTLLDLNTKLPETKSLYYSVKQKQEP